MKKCLPKAREDGIVVDRIYQDSVLKEGEKNANVVY